MDSLVEIELHCSMMLMMCPICAEEFQTRAELCPDCDCRLVPSAIDESAAGQVEAGASRDITFVELCRPRLYPVAMLIKQVLEQSGIAAMIQGGNALSVLPHLVFGGELRVIVDSQQIEYARALYRAYFESDEDTDFIQD